MASHSVDPEFLWRGLQCIPRSTSSPLKRRIQEPFKAAFPPEPTAPVSWQAVARWTNSQEANRKQTMTSDSSDGTKNVGKNALLHGLYAKDVLLPWDSKEDFLKLHEDLKAEFFPDGRAEEEAVLDLAFLHWHKRTIYRVWQSAVLKDPFTEDIIQTKSKSWSDIRKRLRAAATSERTLRGAIENNQSSLLDGLQTGGEKIATTSDAEEIKVILAQTEAILKLVTEKSMPLVKALDQRPDAEQALDRAYAPESLEKVMRLDAAIDVRIGKVLARLVGLKEFKRTPAGGAGRRALEAPRAA